MTRPLSAPVQEPDREALVVEHLDLVRRIACRYAGCGLGLDDLISEGNLGLLRAAELYDPTFGTAFPTYARLWIAQRMHRAITAHSRAVRIPVWRSQRLRKLDRLHGELSAELGCDVTFAALGERIGLDHEALARIERDRVRVDGEAALDQVADDSEPPVWMMSRAERHDEILACLADLTDDELRVVTLKFGLFQADEQSYREMAPLLGRSREWARRLGEGALRRLRESLSVLSRSPRDVVERRKREVVERMRRLGAAARLSLWKLALIAEMEPILILL